MFIYKTIAIKFILKMSRNCDGPLKIIIQVFILNKKSRKKFDEKLIRPIGKYNSQIVGGACI